MENVTLKNYVSTPDFESWIDQPADRPAYQEMNFEVEDEVEDARRDSPALKEILWIILCLKHVEHLTMFHPKTVLCLVDATGKSFVYSYMRKGYNIT